MHTRSTMDDDALLRIDDTLAVPRAELTFRATRAGGPGGQHVNTSSTRVELIWDVARSPALSDAQRARILDKLANRIDGEGVLRLTDAGSRSQHQNRERVTAKLQELTARALRVPKPRKRTRPPKASKEERLREKKRRGETKKLRGSVEPD
jgi:ribosome-associated protein